MQVQAHPEESNASHPASAPLSVAGALPLRDWGLLLAEGADAGSFLHGQLTQDIAHLGPDQARLCGYCSAKGRLLASFWLWQHRAGDASGETPVIAMACSADLVPAMLKRLSMFVLRSKCRLSDAQGRLAVWGLAGPAGPSGNPALREALAAAADAAVGQVCRLGPASVIRIPDAAGLARWLWVAPPQHGPSAAQGLADLPSETWDWLEVQSGVARIVAATSEQFVPQMVNLELTGGVHFQKGCYPGQEVVARSQYRGTLKRRMFAAHADSGVAPGQEVFHESDPGQPAGCVVLAARSPLGEGFDALVELKTALAQAPGGLNCGSARLSLRALPYPLPLEAADPQTASSP